MKKLIMTTLTLMLGTGALLGNCFDIKGEFLYFCPLLDNSLWLGQSVGFPSDVQRFNTTSMFKPAFRVSADLFLPYSPSLIETRFTYFNGGSGEHTIIVPAGAGISLYPLGFGSNNVNTFEANFRHYSGDLVYKHLFYRSRTFDLAALGGVNYTWSRYFEQTSTGTPGGYTYIKYRSFFWGVGPEFGLDMVGKLCGGLSVVGNLRASFLVSEEHSNSTQSDDLTVSIFTHNDPNWSVFPAFDTRLGLNYTSCFRKGGGFNFEVGYEFITYLGGHLRPFGSTNLSSVNNFLNKTLSFHGPYAQIGVRF